MKSERQHQEYQNVWYHPYSLHSQQGLNARSQRREHSGFLIKLEFEKGVYGYGCVHPWPELGDPSGEACLKLLVEGGENALLRAAKDCAQVDAEARKNGVSAFERLAVPLSHATIVGRGEGMVQAVDDAVALGFSCIKVKMVGADDELKSLEHVHRCYPDLMLRLDFNHCLSGGQVLKLLGNMSESLLRRIDFLEDPCLEKEEKEESWEDIRARYGIGVAIDRCLADWQESGSSFDVSVVKPAIDRVEPLMLNAQRQARRVVFTSYMDHPLGQAFAAWCAGVANERYHGIVDICGLMTHGLYEANAFSEQLGKVSPEWGHEQGTGLGFDELLEGIKWNNI